MPFLKLAMSDKNLFLSLACIGFFATCTNCQAEKPSEVELAIENGLQISIDNEEVQHYLAHPSRDGLQLGPKKEEADDLVSALREFWKQKAGENNRATGYPIVPWATAEVGNFGLVAGEGQTWSSSTGVDTLPEKSLPDTLIKVVKTLAKNSPDPQAFPGPNDFKWSLTFEYRYRLTEPVTEDKARVVVQFETVLRTTGKETLPGLAGYREILGDRIYKQKQNELRHVIGHIKVNVSGIDFDSALRKKHRKQFPVFLPGDALLVTSVRKGEGDIDVIMDAKAVTMPPLPIWRGQLQYGFREWNDVSGTFSVDAFLISYAKGKVNLQTKDGRKIAVPLGKLSEKDRKLIQDFVRNPGSQFDGFSQTFGSEIHLAEDDLIDRRSNLELEQATQDDAEKVEKRFE